MASPVRVMATHEASVAAQVAELEHKRRATNARRMRLAKRLAELRRREDDGIAQQKAMDKEVSQLRKEIAEAAAAVTATAAAEAAARGRRVAAQRARAEQVKLFTEWQDKTGLTLTKARSIDAKAEALGEENRELAKHNRSKKAMVDDLGAVVSALQEKVNLERTKRKELQAECRIRIEREAKAGDDAEAATADEEETARQLEERISSLKSDELLLAREGAQVRAAIANTQELTVTLTQEIENIQTDIRHHQQVNLALTDDLEKARARKAEFEHQKLESAAYKKAPPSAYELLPTVLEAH